MNVRSEPGDRRKSVVAAVVIGRNEGERLRRCLASLQHDGVTLIYVDSGSTDGSPDLATAHGAVLVPLNPKQPFTAGRARNEGWRRAQMVAPEAEFIQFVDGDCELEAAWIATAMAFLRDHPDAAIVCGRRRERFPEASFYNRICDQEWNTPVGEANACGGDFMVRSEVMSLVGGFDPRLMAGEEPEMCSRVRAKGWRVWRIDAPMTIHDAAMTRFRQWWRRAIRSGAGYGQAWQATAGQPKRLYAAELRRAITWAGLLPLTSVVLAMVVHPLCLMLAPTAWTLQVARLSRSMGWRKAGLLTAGKGAELIGVLTWLKRRVSGAQSHGIFYK